MTEIRQVLGEYTTHDDSGLRFLAAFTLPEGWRADPSTLVLLRDCAVNDEDGSVRSAAVWAISHRYHDDEQTISLLRERAENDSTPWLRLWAKELADQLAEKASVSE